MCCIFREKRKLASMKRCTMYTSQDIHKTYKNFRNHLLTGKIIKKYSLNKKDIRDIALENLDISKCSRVLDLGCGYGFFIEKLAGKIPAGASITGIDLVEKDNEREFLNKVKTIGCSGTFIHGDAGIIREMNTGQYDCIVASYSLYFFPELISDISRILSPTGVFICLTHSRNTLCEVLSHIPAAIRSVGGTVPEQTAISSLFNAFCIEDGIRKLEPFFGRIELIPYCNSLRFQPDEVKDCITYLDNKRILLFKEITNGKMEIPRQVLEQFYDKIVDEARRKGVFHLTKDDAVFRSYRPQHREKPK